MLSYMLPPVLEEKHVNESESSSTTSSLSTNVSSHHQSSTNQHERSSNRSKLHLHFLQDDEHISNDGYLKAHTINEKLPKDSSLSSFNSSNDTVANFTTSSSTATTKNPSLKRVSFGSSKGSMVETLIYESPIQDEAQPLIDCSNDSSIINGSENIDTERSKVRVSFFQQTEPQSITSDLLDLIDVNQHSENLFLSSPNFIMSQSQIIVNGGAACQFNEYKRQESTDSGWENPFRPDGELSREADEIVQMIKGGKPITPTSPMGHQETENQFKMATDAENLQKQQNTNLMENANGNRALNHNNSSNKLLNNGTSPAMSTALTTTTTIVNNDANVQHEKMIPGQSSDIEHIVLKKKSRCKCCVLQ